MCAGVKFDGGSLIDAVPRMTHLTCLRMIAAGNSLDLTQLAQLCQLAVRVNVNVSVNNLLAICWTLTTPDDRDHRPRRETTWKHPLRQLRAAHRASSCAKLMLIAGVPCFLRLLAVPRVWGFLRVTQLAHAGQAGCTTPPTGRASPPG